jgi:hypothetical protein
MVRLALLLPPPHKHHDDHAEDERAQRIEHGYEIVATGDVDDHSDKRGNSVDAPRFDRFGRLTGLPLPHAFNRGEVGDRHDHLESYEADPCSLRDRPSGHGDAGNHQTHSLIPSEEDFPASLFDKKRRKDDGNHDAFVTLSAAFTMLWSCEAKCAARLMTTPISKISQVAIRGQVSLRISFAQ